MDKPRFSKPLDTERQEIRLLELVPGNFEDALICNLKVTSLQESSHYEALSYVWGDPKETEEITICNQLYRARKTLARALRHLRKQDETRILWVDAVCIDQENLEERNQQVKLMGQIYRQASSVEACFSKVRPELVPFVKKMASDPELHREDELRKLEVSTGLKAGMFHFVFELFRHPW